MASVPTDPQAPAAGGPDPRRSSVLVVLVVRNGAAWLPESLASVAGQTYERLGVIAVDCGSTDGSVSILEASLGEGRIIDLPRGSATPDAFRAVLADERAADADYVLILHDDAVLAVDAVERMVETAEQVDITGIGIVGAKIVAWDDPRMLLDVGVSADRFGHPYSPLESQEMDHGQHDRVREVFAVAACAVLIARPVWTRLGPFDERLSGRSAEVDYCWRARIAGFHVLWSPLAKVQHARASRNGLRVVAGSGRADRSNTPRGRYLEEQGALAATLKNYRLLSLLWVFPLAVLQSTARWIGLMVGRRFGEAWQLFLGWMWNLLHIFGTLVRRRRTQHSRRARDHTIRPYMISGGVRVRKWLEAFERVVPGDVEIPDDDAERVRLRAATASAVHAHPVATAWIIALVLGIFATRGLWGHGQLTGGAVPVMPPNAGDFFSELISGVRTTVLGGQQAASPALAMLGGASWLTFGDPAIAERLLLALTIPLAAISAYRFLLRPAGRPAPAVVGAGIYALSPVALWGFSQGRLPFMIAFAILPRLADRIGTAVGTVTRGRGRFVVGTGAFLAVGLSFWPGIVLPVALLLVAYLVLPEERRRRFRGLTLLAFTAVAGAALAFPLVIDLIRGRGAGLRSTLGVDAPKDLIRLVIEPGSWSWPVAWFVVVGAILGFALAERRVAAARFLLAGLAGVGAAWASIAGYLPAPLSNAPAYLALAALCDVALITLGLSTALGRIASARVGPWKIVASTLVIMVSLGLTLTSLLAAYGPWEVGNDKLPAAWPIVARSNGEFRVLWLAGTGAVSFPAPGGDPQARADDGDDSVWWGMTDRVGASALDTGRDEIGNGYTFVIDALDEARAGTTRHLGRLLAPAAIRFIVLPETGVPESLQATLERQVDLHVEPAGSLDVFVNEAWLPAAWSAPDAGYSGVTDPGSLLTADVGDVSPLTADGNGWTGVSEGTGQVWVGDQWAEGWVIEDAGSSRAVEQELGWGLGTGLPAGSFDVRYGLGAIRAAEIASLVLLWLVALWVTRKPVRR